MSTVFQAIRSKAKFSNSLCAGDGEEEEVMKMGMTEEEEGMGLEKTEEVTGMEAEEMINVEESTG
mgnify:CR=1 FL=1